MSGLNKAPLLPHNNTNSSSPFPTTTTTTSLKCLNLNPMTNNSASDSANDKENLVPAVDTTGCGGGGSGQPFTSWKGKKLQQQQQQQQQTSGAKGQLNRVALKPSSLQLCMKLSEPDSGLGGGSRPWDPLHSSSSDVWEFSDSESAPASSWSTLPNRLLLCRPLPLDVGRCTCIIAKEPANGKGGVALYSLYTNEGRGRQDRKLAVARHRRRNGRSLFIVAQNPKGISCTSDESFLGSMSANLMGSKYQIWDQERPLNSSKDQPKRLLGVVAFIPTITTLTGSCRSMRAWIPKHQSMQLKSTSTKIQHMNGLPKNWEEKRDRAHQLYSRSPYYNYATKRYELDFRERAGRAGHRVQTSVKNFQLTVEENGRQTILQLGRIGKSKYIMDFRYPLTGYQAFCICLASIDSKLCCSL
ncbi:Tubby-like protein 4 [Ananas comosus]|uniref:Tubby-like protein 4 n=1 Tax=Ananas comosus TaxID=4615 RepID=A0A199V0L2_ANACO|nr:Tubby-like protein 4 [Ananas comosus]